MKELVTIIVPVYNVQKYLNQCLESIVNQTYKELEIILVDDGSTDESGALCDEWAKKDIRIKVVHKKNEGLGMARNTGLANATGEYVKFIDSDDYISLNCIELLYETMHREKVDIVYGMFERFHDDVIMQVPKLYESIQIFQEEEVIETVLLGMIGTRPEDQKDTAFDMSACLSLYKLSLLNKENIRFRSEREYISEDLLFNIDYLQHVKSVCVIPEKFYFYRMNMNSLTTSYNPKRFEREIKMYQYLNEKLGEFLEKERYELHLQRYLIARSRVCIGQISKSELPDKNKQISLICNHELLSSVMKSYPYRKNPLKQRIFNFFLKYKIVFMLKKLCELNTSKSS